MSIPEEQGPGPSLPPEGEGLSAQRVTVEADSKHTDGVTESKLCLTFPKPSLQNDARYVNVSHVCVPHHFQVTFHMFAVCAEERDNIAFNGVGGQ